MGLLKMDKGLSIDKIIDMAKKNPVLFGSVGAGVVLVFFLVIFWLCRGEKAPKRKQSDSEDKETIEVKVFLMDSFQKKARSQNLRNLKISSLNQLYENIDELIGIKGDQASSCTCTSFSGERGKKR
eukprot:TRINITY_DN534_c0_g1_i2.p1 TRINITY_DN534_c0_g1~~TRINITY_DN534_c0_g1_i2.p1  ORF type:complete len:126 (-),score=25.35 TRINITY_DN534_c0_g1_i2:173-550(-)